MHQRQVRRRVFVHGAGRRGTDAWPTVDTSAGSFVSFRSEMTIPHRTVLVETMLADAPTTVFAHSIGAVPAVLATALQTDSKTVLVLVEPALYDVVRGCSAVERHIGTVTEARAQAAAGNLRGCWGILRPLMFGGPFDAALWEEERPLAEHWASTSVPWGHGVRPEMLDGIPTLVVTGGWNDEYELIAAQLRTRGAEHTVLSGAAHRPQDVHSFGEVVRDFESRLR